MKYCYLGNSGLAVSRVCLGSMTFGEVQWGCDEEVSFAVLNAFMKQGGNFIDTADKYTSTLSEQIIGKWLDKQNRDDLVIATKCFFKTSGDINARGLSRKHIINACEASLNRLRTDYIDLYQMHAPDPQTPLEETVAALDSLVQQGKVRYIGLSNWPAWKVMKAAYITRNCGAVSFVSGQYLYNLLKRDIEAEVLPACKESGLGVVCWSPLSGGMLTGKYKDASQPPKGTRLAIRSDLSKTRYKQWYEKSIAVVSAVIEIAERNGVSTSTVALAWLLKDSRIASVVVGAKEPEQIIENCQAGDWILPDADYKKLCSISHAAQRYPYDWINDVVRDWYNRIL